MSPQAYFLTLLALALACSRYPIGVQSLGESITAPVGINLSSSTSPVGEISRATGNLQDSGSRTKIQAPTEETPKHYKRSPSVKVVVNDPERVREALTKFTFELGWEIFRTNYELNHRPVKPEVMAAIKQDFERRSLASYRNIL